MATPVEVKKGSGMELLLDIYKEAGINPEEIPHARIFIDTRDTWWKQGAATSLWPELVVLCIFFDEGGTDVRVYLIPTKEKDKEGTACTLTRVTLSRTDKSLVAESIGNLELFKDLIKDELLGPPELEPGEKKEAAPANGAAAAPASAPSPPAPSA